MDPWAEAERLARFLQLAEGKTAVIITHRLATAMAADVIYVVEDGGMVESGTHSELIARDGMYAQCFAGSVEAT